MHYTLYNREQVDDFSFGILFRVNKRVMQRMELAMQMLRFHFTDEHPV